MERADTTQQRASLSPQVCAVIHPSICEGMPRSNAETRTWSHMAICQRCRYGNFGWSHINLWSNRTSLQGLQALLAGMYCKRLAPLNQQLLTLV